MERLAILIAATLCFAPDGPAWKGVPLRAEEELPVAEVRPGAALELFTEDSVRPRGSTQEDLRRLLVGRVRSEGGATLVDPEGVGEDWVELQPDRVRVLGWFVSGRTVPLQFFRRGDRWWVCSAHLLSSTKGDAPVRLLDADADGEFLGADDLVSFRGAPFRPVAGTLLLDDGELRLEMRLKPSRRGPLLQLRAPEDLPEDMGRAQAVAYAGTNRLRTAQGFPPLRYDAQLSRALSHHTEYLQLHDPTKAGTLETYFGEDPARAGYTQEGDVASRGGSVNYLQPGQDTEAFVGGHLRMTHSRRNLFQPGPGAFGYGETQSWCFMAVRGSEEGPGVRRWVVPAAGARDTPLECARNWPFPQSYPTLYDEPRGLPVTVQVSLAPDEDGGVWRVRTLGLRVAESGAEVGGFFFPLDDVQQGAACDTWFFVPQAPLQAETRYEAVAALERVRVAGEGTGVVLGRETFLWEFETGAP